MTPKDRALAIESVVALGGVICAAGSTFSSSEPVRVVLLGASALIGGVVAGAMLSQSSARRPARARTPRFGNHWLLRCATGPARGRAATCCGFARKALWFHASGCWRPRRTSGSNRARASRPPVFAGCGPGIQTGIGYPGLEHGQFDRVHERCGMSDTPWLTCVCGVKLCRMEEFEHVPSVTCGECAREYTVSVNERALLEIVRRLVNTARLTDDLERRLAKLEGKP